MTDADEKAEMAHAEYVQDELQRELREQRDELLAACEGMLRTFAPSAWSGCARPGDWRGPSAERYADTEAECPCHSHQLIRAARAAIAKAKDP